MGQSKGETGKGKLIQTANCEQTHDREGKHTGASLTYIHEFLSLTIDLLLLLIIYKKVSKLSN